LTENGAVRRRFLLPVIVNRASDVSQRKILQSKRGVIFLAEGC
jgi:hypothetical protein